MTDALFAAIDAADPEAESRSGYRLERLEVRNWGTFDKRAWSFETRGRNGLLTGDIGSGKSTVVDAITTLLLPAHRISYNKAAGAETRERTLRSYVLGYYKSERNEATGASQPVPLRDATAYSVILAVFTNQGYKSAVTLAQVFWMRDGSAGQPDRFFVTADRSLSIVGDFSDFGTEMTTLKKRLRAAGARVHDHFPEYGKDFRRRLGIESDQAMELFHQTVSMKSVGNLTDFVRDHMLEPFDARDWTARIVSHFDDLTKAHEAVRRAQAQLAALEPLLADCDAHDKLGSEIGSLTAQRSALRFFFAERKAGLLERQIAEAAAHRTRRQAELDDLAVRLRQLRERETGLRIELAGHGGNRLVEIERQLAEEDQVRGARLARSGRFAELLTQAKMGPVSTADQFAARLREIADARVAARQTLADCQNAMTEVAIEARRCNGEAERIGAELRSLRSRKNNIPSESLVLRKRLCQELRLTEDTLPFAGELIAVRPEETAWEGAAERVLRGFALSLLVPDQHYPVVSDWINEHHLAARLVYYRVPVVTGPLNSPAGPAAANSLFAKLDIKDTGFYPWLERELAVRASHECAQSMKEFRRAAKAVTMAGQIKGPGGRHEKDDRRPIDDRSTYVLGWSNERKIDALLRRAAATQEELNAVRAEQAGRERARDAAVDRGQVLSGLDQTRDFTEIDWQSAVTRIEDLKAEKFRLEHASAEFGRLSRDLDSAKEQITAAEERQSAVNKLIGALDNEVSDAGQTLDDALAALAEPGCALAREQFPGIAGLLAQPPLSALGYQTPAACDRAEAAASREITALIDRRSTRQGSLGNKIVGRMAEFRRDYPAETTDLDDSVASAAGYRELHERLVADDLPRFQAQFKAYLNTNTIREIANFRSQLSKQADLIKGRVATINDSLVGVDYNPGRYIRLDAQPTPNTDVREFRQELRACTDDTLSGDDSDQYSEQKFLQVSQIIARFRGREGQTEADRAWTRRVTDVRNWFTFSASERWREDDTEYENYTDSGGKSGGQKEKLAYTILAASLAYQFKLDWSSARSKTFRFVVIDEAFGRGSDESTRFALQLFRRLGLQLLIVTPLQKIHVIEPYVAAVGFVDNPDHNYSRLQTLTIEEYRARRVAHDLIQQATLSAAGA
ncbi:MAG TPA: SbcC/MukB-like Walker B domain-containing protein [Streptosporangiaceae bacterium]|nr:SbcC/MukB-like Walker B domain-containing protein [Streptosporangiaceae bacterium]